MRSLLGLVSVACLSAALALQFGAAKKPGSLETIYVVNRAPSIVSNATIERDIPAWEKAANRDFSPVWDTPQIKLKLVHTAPAGAPAAIFDVSGPVQGAIAYHTVFRGAPQIIVYAGVAAQYHFSYSTAFTHELFEMLADPNINAWNWHWESYLPFYYVGNSQQQLAGPAIWFNEVCDPVEAYSYSINRVAISDFITPNWFNDHVNGRFDEMNTVHNPFEVLRGGYAQAIVNGQYLDIQNFSRADKAAVGFYKGEKLSHG